MIGTSGSGVIPFLDEEDPFCNADLEWLIAINGDAEDVSQVKVDQVIDIKASRCDDKLVDRVAGITCVEDVVSDVLKSGFRSLRSSRSHCRLSLQICQT